MTGIAEMFAEHQARLVHEYEIAIFIRRQRRLKQLIENTKRWRIMNPEKYRALRKRTRKAWEKRYPEKVRAHKARWRARHLEHARERDRRNKRAERARKKLAMAAERSAA